MANAGKKVRIGFVGAGTMGQCAHLRNYATLPECEVAAIAELRPQTAQRVAERYRIPGVYGTAEEMLAREELDGIVASQPFTRHGLVLPGLLRAGKPLFIEKPLAGSIETAERILRDAERHGVMIMVGYHKRSDPAAEYAKAEIDRLKSTGELGRLTYLRMLMPAGEWIAGGFWDLLDAGDPRPGLTFDPAPADMSEPAYKLYLGFVNYYIHQVNLIRWLVGEDWRVTYGESSGVLLAGQSAGGVPCVLEMSPYKTTVDWQESTLVAFEHGYVKLDLPPPLAVNQAGRVELLADPGKSAVPRTVAPHLPRVHAMRRQAQNFIAAIRGERPPPCQAAEALQDLKLAREYLRLWKGF